jgi:cytochrome c6
MFHGCTSSDQPVQPKEELKEQVEQSTPQAEQTVFPGENLFNEHCKKCHRNGGNIINPEKTLYREVLRANNIMTPEDIVSIIRNPGKGMPKHSKDQIPDKEARQIGEYILKTFR